MSGDNDRSLVLWWDWDANVLAKALAKEYRIPLGGALESARNLVILDGLKDGDTNPYRDWVQRGHNASPRVQRAIAYMLEWGDPDCDFDPQGTDDPEDAEMFSMPLSVVRNGAGRPKDKRRQAAKEMAGKYSSALMDRGMKGREVADSDTKKVFQDLGENFSLGTIEAARKKYRRERRGK